MKTAISVPDELFRQADDFAKRERTSRSQLYATALAEYLAKRRNEDITARLNEVYALKRGDVDPALRRAQAQTVGSGDW